MSEPVELDKYGKPVGPPKFTRRHPLREVRSAYLDLTSPLRGATGKFSQFRIILALFAWGFLRNWPGAWNWPVVVAFSVLVVALPLDALFARVPVAEALAALQAVLVAATGNAVSKLGVVGKTKHKLEESTETTITPVKPADPDEPPG